MICSQCGTQIIGDAKYCHLCGGDAVDEKQIDGNDSLHELYFHTTQAIQVSPASPPMRGVFASPIAQERPAPEPKKETPVAPLMREVFASPITQGHPASAPKKEAPVAPPMRPAFAAPIMQEGSTPYRILSIPESPVPKREVFTLLIPKGIRIPLNLEVEASIASIVPPPDGVVTSVVPTNPMRRENDTAEERFGNTGIPVAFAKKEKSSFPIDLLQTYNAESATTAEPAKYELAKAELEKSWFEISLQAKEDKPVIKPESGKEIQLPDPPKERDLPRAPRKRKPPSFLSNRNSKNPMLWAGIGALVVVVSVVIILFARGGSAGGTTRADIAKNYINAVIEYDWDGINKSCAYSIDDANEASLKESGISKESYAQMLKDEYGTTEMKEAYQGAYKTHAYMNLKARYGTSVSFSFEEAGAEKELSSSELEELKGLLNSGPGPKLIDLNSLKTVYLQNYIVGATGERKTDTVTIPIYITKIGSEWKVIPTKLSSYYDISQWGL